MNGPKARGLERLAARSRVPQFAVLGRRHFASFLRANDLSDAFHAYWGLAVGPCPAEAITPLRRLLARAFALGSIPQDTALELANCVTRLDGEAILRSSASLEDGDRTSWAGQFHSEFGVVSPETADAAVRTCWSAVLRPRVAAYGRRVGAKEPPELALIVQRAVDAAVSGVVVVGPVGSDSPSGRAVVIEATVGLGLGVVSGRASPERWSGSEAQVTRSWPWTGGPVWRLATGRSSRPAVSDIVVTPGGSRVEIRGSGPDAQPGLWAGRAVPADVRVLDSPTAHNLAQGAFGLASDGHTWQELEWALDIHGVLWWLQERPVASPAVAAAPGTNDSALMRGIPAAAGRAAGIGWWIDGRPRPTGRAVAFAQAILPDAVERLDGVRAVVTAEGGLLSHGAVVCREFGIPCLVAASPFPPAVEVERPVEVDADDGVVRAVGRPERSRAKRPLPLPRLEAPAPAKDGELFTWRLSERLRRRISPELSAMLHLTATAPGVVGPVTVLPDVMAAHISLGIPIGIAFRSERFHPTAVSDCGDGFRLMAIRGTSRELLHGAARAVTSALLDVLRGDHELARLARAELSLDRLLSEGIRALEGTRWAEQRPERVENEGVLPCVAPVTLSDSARRLAEWCLGWHGEAGHFLELLAPVSPEAGAISAVTEDPVMFFHTGTMEMGLEVLRENVSFGPAVALREGLDDPDRIGRGVWGLDVTSMPGAELLNTALGLANYSFARRSVLQKMAEHALQQVLGDEIEVLLLSDIMHTGVRIDGDALLHQQGAHRSGGTGIAVPMVIAGAPGVRSYAFSPRAERWYGHGTVKAGFRSDLFDTNRARQIAGATYFASSPPREDVVIRDAQGREALEEALEDGVDAASSLEPIMCIRGLLNGQPKVI